MLEGHGAGHAPVNEARARQLFESFATPEEAAAHLIREGPCTDAQLLGYPLVTSSSSLDDSAVAEFAAGLRLHGWSAVRQIGLKRHLLLGALEEAMLLKSKMKPGLISRPDMPLEHDAVKRCDDLVWLTDRPDRKAADSGSAGMEASSYWPTAACPCLRKVQEILRILGYGLACTLEEAIDGHTDTMLACYGGGGAYYVPHVDSDESDSRRLTLILYLNDEWQEEDGGCLQIMDPVMFEWQRIRPLMGTLVAFWSSNILHQVRPTYAPRYAVTIWFLHEGLTDDKWEACD